MKICSVCGKPYEYAIKVYWEKDGTRCVHDDPSGPTHHRYKSYGQQKEYFFKKEHPFKKILGPE